MDEQDPDILALKRANRRPLWTGLGVVGGVVVLGALWVVNGKASVRSSLEAEGHTDVRVEIHSPVEFGYESKKGTMVCGGTITRLPFSTQKSEGCFGPRGGETGTTTTH